MVGLVLNVYTNSLCAIPKINKLCLGINHFFSVYFCWGCYEFNGYVLTSMNISI